MFARFWTAFYSSFHAAWIKKDGRQKPTACAHTVRINDYACVLPLIFAFSHTTVSRIVLLSGLGA